MLCDYGCGNEAIHTFKNGKRCCSERSNKCPEIRKRNSETNKVKQAGENNAMFGRNHSSESKKKNSDSHKGQKAWNKGISPYNKGISLIEMYGEETANEINEKRRKKLKNKSYVELHGEEKAAELRAQCGSYHKGQTWDEYWGKEKATEMRDTLSKSLSIAILEGRLTERKPGGKYKYLTGRFTSIKTNMTLVYQSSFELAMFRKLDNDDNVEWFKRPDFWILYYYDGVKHRYHPDVLVKFKNKKYNCLYEIKPSDQLKDKVNIEKFKAAIVNEEKFNYKFEIITEVLLKDEIKQIYLEFGIH
jgi:hypothetical protein